MNGKTILLADDSDLVATMLTEALNQAGFQVERAKDGYEAVEMTYRIIPDVIIMDIDMPLMKGYQASRLLKMRRGVRDIPILMHTANTEDKDRFWSYNSGASAFIVKDFENIEPLVEAVRKLIQHDLPDLSVIQEDAKKMNRDFISENVSNLFDRELYQSTVMNQLSDAGRTISSLSATALRVLELLDLACDRHIAVLILRYGREVIPYVFPSEEANKDMSDDFLAVCLDDFMVHFDRNSVHVNDPVYFNIEVRTDWTKLNLEKRRLSSYHYAEIKSSSEETIGTIHIGHLNNNYFTEQILSNISCFLKETGIILHNAMLFKQVMTMEREMRSAFSKFVPPEIINDLITRKTNSTLLAGEKRSVSILFSDLRSFTTLSEENAPEAVVSFLNRYFEMMGDIIQENGGYVDKFFGDGILAVFGAPKSWPNNTDRAVQAAIAMSRALPMLDTGSILLPPEGLDIGLGIHSGDAIVGTIGSLDKSDYTVIGDTVNLASRLEGLTKIYRTRIIFSKSAFDDIKERKLLPCRFREIEEVIVKGKGKPTMIFAVEDEESLFLPPEAFESYKKGLSMYRLRNWNIAAEYFEKTLSLQPHDPLSSLFLERCTEFKKNPPQADWDLVQRFITK
jgi:adenylate cyclase